jgi:hypothetical protein
VIPTHYVNATGISAQRSSEEFTHKFLALENKAGSVCRSTPTCCLYRLSFPAAWNFGRCHSFSTVCNGAVSTLSKHDDTGHTPGRGLGALFNRSLAVRVATRISISAAVCPGYATHTTLAQQRLSQAHKIDHAFSRVCGVCKNRFGTLSQHRLPDICADFEMLHAYTRPDPSLELIRSHR